jgi:hypothetical protein
MKRWEYCHMTNEEEKESFFGGPENRYKVRLQTPEGSKIIYQSENRHYGTGIVDAYHEAYDIRAAILAKLGREGWQLMGSDPSGDTWFKRPLEDTE